MCTYTQKIETSDPGGKKKLITLDAIDSSGYFKVSLSRPSLLCWGCFFVGLFLFGWFFKLCSHYINFLFISDVVQIIFYCQGVPIVSLLECL